MRAAAGIAVQAPGRRRSVAGAGLLALALSSCGIGADAHPGQAGGTAEPAPEPARANRLAKESSPYLLLHARNPVDWYPWGEEALSRARTEDKPIFLSVGYSTCYWCHVMEREVFSDPEIAALMRQHRHDRVALDTFDLGELDSEGRGGHEEAAEQEQE